MIRFDGKAHSIHLEEKILSKIDKCPNKNSTLAIVQVGDNASSEKYISLKLRLCEKIGVVTKYIKIDSILPDSQILNEIRSVFNDVSVGGVMIQLPLPRMSLNCILDEIPLDKDVDLLSSKSIEQYYLGISKKTPPVVRAVDYFIRINSIPLHNTSVTVIGYGKLVGKPVSHYLESLGAKVTKLDNYKTGDSIEGDLVILSAGVPNLVNGSDLSKGCSVIDFGSTIVNGKTIGDLNLDSDLSGLLNVSPSPGGMGPLVVRYLVMNYLEI